MRKTLFTVAQLLAAVAVGLVLQFSLPISFHLAVFPEIRHKPAFSWPTPSNVQCYDPGHWYIEQYNPGRQNI